MRSFFHSHHCTFFIGDMRELGSLSEEMHTRLAQDIVDIVPHDVSVSFYLV